MDIYSVYLYRNEGSHTSGFIISLEDCLVETTWWQRETQEYVENDSITAQSRSHVVFGSKLRGDRFVNGRNEQGIIVIEGSPTKEEHDMPKNDAESIVECLVRRLRLATKSQYSF